MVYFFIILFAIDSISDYFSIFVFLFYAILNKVNIFKNVISTDIYYLFRYSRSEYRYWKICPDIIFWF